MVVMKEWFKRALGSMGFEIHRRKTDRWLRGMGIRTVLDIGANEGQFAWMIHALLPEARIYAFEPLEDCYRKLRYRMRRVPLFQAFNLALGAEEGIKEMHRSEFSPSSSLLPMRQLHKQAFPKSRRTRVEPVEVARLDLIAHQLEWEEKLLIKIDVQGYEREVIKGGPATISRAVVLVVETSFESLYEGQPLFEDVLEMLKDLGFRYHGNLDQIWSPVDGSVLQADALFVKATIPT
jgi:FkbM family methyltransferase